MNGDQLAVERAAWAVALKHEFPQHGYTFREHLNDYQTMFMVRHADTPDWTVKVTICSAHQQRNRIEINGTVLGHSCKTNARQKLIALLNGLRTNFEREHSKMKEKESVAAKWRERQAAELAKMPDLPGMNVEIIRKGPNEGKYAVTLLPGNPLEHLTLEQYCDFYNFLRSLGYAPERA